MLAHISLGIVLCCVKIAIAAPAPSTEQQSQRLSSAVLGLVPATRGSNNADRQQQKLLAETVEELVPAETRRFFNELTSEERGVLQSVLARSSSYSNVSEVLHDLRNGSVRLFDKAVQLVTGIRQTMSGLSPAARAFVDESATKFRALFANGLDLQKMKSGVVEIVASYRALDDATKIELKAAFPAAAGVLQNSTFQLIASGLFGIPAESGVDGGNAQKNDENNDGDEEMHQMRIVKPL